MESMSRYIVRRAPGDEFTRVPVHDLLHKFSNVKILKSTDPDYVVVLMDPGTETKIRQRLPNLLIEEDIQYRPVFLG
jgi:hypothetical protein